MVEQGFLELTCDIIPPMAMVEAAFDGDGRTGSGSLLQWTAMVEKMKEG